MLARLSILFASAGLFVTSYLSGIYYSGNLVPCRTGASCSEALYNPAYHLFGVSPAAFGVGFYAMCSLAALVWVVRMSGKARRAGTILALVGVLVSAALIFLLIRSGSSCVWCIASALISVCLLGSFALAHDKPILGNLEIGVAALLPLLALFVGGLAGMRPRDADTLDPRLLGLHAAELETSDSPQVGKSGPTVVLFGEIACPSCRIAMARLLPFAEAGKARLLIRHLPIESHPISAPACRLAEAAHRQDRLPNLIRAAEGRIISSAADLNDLADAAGLRAQDPAGNVESIIRRDQQLARRLGVTGAPTLIWIERGRAPEHLSLAEIEHRLGGV